MYLLQDRVNFILASFQILLSTNGLFEALSYTLSQRTDFPSVQRRKIPTQSETITRTVSLPVWYILEYPPVSVEKTADARSVSSVNRFEICINQIVLRQDI